MNSVNWKTAEKLLKDGAVGVIPTDTIYGFSACIYNQRGINRIYEIKKRNKKKMLIVLSSSLKQIESVFPVAILERHSELLKEAIRPTSIIYEFANNIPGDSIFSEKKDVVIRIPSESPKLLELLENIGPIVSTSVNKKGDKPLTNPLDIKKVFGEKVDFIIDDGVKDGTSSRIIKVGSGGKIEEIR